ncbi:MAG: hypothetical protein AAB676_00015 [Verrucomicrobiota bacterium]
MGGRGPNWDVTTSANGRNGLNLDVFDSYDNVTFNARGASQSTVNPVGTLRPGTVMVNAASDYRLGPGSSGQINV